MKAEAKVWRAWYHIRLLNWYGRNDGIPYVDKALLPSEIYMARTPVNECLDRINAELDEVINSEALPFIWDEGRRDRTCPPFYCLDFENGCKSPIQTI